MLNKHPLANMFSSNTNLKNNQVFSSFFSFYTASQLPRLSRPWGWLQPLVGVGQDNPRAITHFLSHARLWLFSTPTTAHIAAHRAPHRSCHLHHHRQQVRPPYSLTALSFSSHLKSTQMAAVQLFAPWFIDIVQIFFHLYSHCFPAVKNILVVVLVYKASDYMWAHWLRISPSFAFNFRLVS